MMRMAMRNGVGGVAGVALVGCAALLLSVSGALAASAHFHVPARLKPQVDFWVSIFATYGKRQIVIHDTQRLDRVYSVLDFSDLDAAGLSETRIQLAMKDQEDAEKARPAAVQSDAKPDDKTVVKKALGLDLATISPDLRKRYKIKDSVNGVVITATDQNSAAAEKRLTAGDVMEPPHAVVFASAGPRTALKTMRDMQTSACFVTDSGRKLLGVVRDKDVLRQVREGSTDLT